MESMDDEASLPRDFEALRDMILIEREGLPKRLAQVAAYALDNPDEIAFGTAASIATSAGVQPSTLIRFAQHLGYDGFTSLQAVFRERLRERTVSYEERLSALRGDTHGMSKNRVILNGFLTAASHSIETMLAQCRQTRCWPRRSDILAEAETIYLLARRRSYPITAYMAYAFGKLKIRNQLIEFDSWYRSGNAVICTSRRMPRSPSAFHPTLRDSSSMPRRLPHATCRSWRSPISAFSPLAQSAKVWFEVAERDFSGFRSLSATMALAMALTVAVAEATAGNAAKGSNSENGME